MLVPILKNLQRSGITKSDFIELHMVSFPVFLFIGTIRNGTTNTVKTLNFINYIIAIVISDIISQILEMRYFFRFILSFIITSDLTGYFSIFPPPLQKP